MLGWSQLRNSKTKALEKQEQAAFDTYLEKRGLDHHALLIEAQTYRAELHRRDERTSWWIEIGIDVFIVLLIGWEIREGYKQSAALDQVAGNIQITATALKDLQATMADMNRTIQAEREQASRVSVEGAFDGVSIVTITNKGKPNLLVYGTKVGNNAYFAQIANVIPGGGERNVNVTLSSNAQVVMRREIGARERYTLPIEIYFESDDGTQYVATAMLMGTRNPTNDFITIAMGPLEVVKRRWR